MQTILNYNPKEYRSREYGIGLLTKLQKAGINTEVLKSYSKHTIAVEDRDAEKAKQTLKDYVEAKNAAHEAFKKGIKINMDKQAFQVKFLYNKLKARFTSEIYLPDGWAYGKSMQNYSQSDFWSFNYVTISGSKTCNGRKVLVSMLSNRFVYILPADFMSRINGLLEDKQMEGVHIGMNYRVDDLLRDLAEQTFEGSAFKQMVDDKKIFYTNK